MPIWMLGRAQASESAMLAMISMLSVVATSEIIHEIGEMNGDIVPISLCPLTQPKITRSFGSLLNVMFDLIA
jgi:hypothetical protein